MVYFTTSFTLQHMSNLNKVYSARMPYTSSYVVECMDISTQQSLMLNIGIGSRPKDGQTLAESMPKGDVMRFQDIFPYAEVAAL